ncbi:MAG: hypothetical protein J6P41_03350 [Prevotella sp.]|nr:hypothetical protein [Prevotella sp.]
MKKYLIALTLLLTLGASAPSAAQTHKKQPREELVDSSSKVDEFEAFSDTTLAETDSTDSISSSKTFTVWTDDDDDNTVSLGMDHIFESLDVNDVAGMVFALLVVGIIFVFSPLVIFGLLLFFIFRNRRQKMKLAEMAMKNGQPIPDQLLRDQPSDAKDAYQSGMRQLFLGIGLMIFLGFTIGKIGVGIGALVFFIGVGKVAIGRKSQNNADPFLNNPSNNHRYE